MSKIKFGPLPYAAEATRSYSITSIYSWTFSFSGTDVRPVLRSDWFYHNHHRITSKLFYLLIWQFQSSVRQIFVVSEENWFSTLQLPGKINKRSLNNTFCGVSWKQVFQTDFIGFRFTSCNIFLNFWILHESSWVYLKVFCFCFVFCFVRCVFLM